jgi:hypothetical protein
VTSERDDDAPERMRRLAHLSLSFVIDSACSGMAGLKTLDAVLVMAVNQANIAPLTRDPEARARYGALDAPAPDDDRRPVSVSAIATSLKLPYETTRRRLKQLAAEGVCTLSEAGAVVPQSFLASAAYLDTTRVLHERVWAFYRDVAATGLLAELPPSRYSVEAGIPVRGAVRLVADYLLRTSASFVDHFGDLVSGLVGMAVLCASTARVPEASRATALAERLQLPQETVRRHALELVERGRCVRSRQGLAVPEEMLAEGPLAELFRDNAVQVQRLFAGLAERGVVQAWELLRPSAAGTGPQPLARA